MSIKKQFNIIIVTYNSADDITNLLNDIKKANQAYLKQTIIIDNNSQDKTPIIIKLKFSQVSVIKNNTNVGYGKAVNQAVRLINLPYFFLFNPDIRLTPDFFTKMLQAAQSSKVAAIGPLQYTLTNNKKQLSFTWSYTKIKCLAAYMSKKLGRKISPLQPLQATFLNAGCLLINTPAFRRIGYLNEKYFLYGEEPDLFLKLKLHNYTCLLHPGAEIIHYRKHSIKTLSVNKYLAARFNAYYNISDALIRGYSQLAIQKIGNLARKTLS